MFERSLKEVEMSKMVVTVVSLRRREVMSGGLGIVLSICLRVEHGLLAAMIDVRVITLRAWAGVWFIYPMVESDVCVGRCSASLCRRIGASVAGRESILSALP